MKINKGDLFILGKHRLMCGDSLSLISVQKLLNKKQANMLFTDPPYNINYDRENHSWKHDYKSKIENFQDSNFDIIKFLNLLKAGIVGGACYVCCGTNQIGKIYEWCVKNIKQQPRQLIWYKNNMSISRSDYHRRYESCMYFWFKGKKFLGPRNGSNQDVWFIKNRVVSTYIHPTQKPVRLIMKAITNSSDKGDIVLDLFGGSGTTLIASEKTDRICYMMELDPKYIEKIINRWEQLTKLKARKI